MRKRFHSIRNFNCGKWHVMIYLSVKRNSAIECVQEKSDVQFWLRVNEHISSAFGQMSKRTHTRPCYAVTTFLQHYYYLLIENEIEFPICVAPFSNLI